MTRKTFLLVVVDHDRKEFNVLGPIADDTPFIDRVIAAQESGRNVNCMTPGPGDPSKHWIDLGYKEAGGALV